MRDRPRYRPFFIVPVSQGGEDTVWHPRADVYRTRTGWVLKFELAGVTRDDVSVCVSGSCLTVSGIRRDCLMEEGCSYHSMEIAYNRFERTVELPCDLTQSRLGMEFRDGIFLVRIATGERSEP